MPLKPLPFRVIRQKLVAAGFMEVGQEGSYVKFAKHGKAGTRTAVVPHHREVTVGTISSIPRQGQV